MVRSFRNYLVNEGAKWFVLTGWLAVNVGLFYSTFFYYYYGPQFYYLHQMLGYGLCLSRASAACINLNACIILLPMCRIVLKLIRSFSKVCRQCRRLLDKSKSFHIACGYMICVMSALHCGAHAFNAVNFCASFNFQFPAINVAVSSEQNPLLVIVTSVPGVTGLLMVTCLLAISVTASSPIRRASYRRFWKTHHLFILFYALLLLHACSGVLKYQTNTEEHIPGCFIDLNAKGNMTNRTIVLPEPEMEPHPGQFIVHAEPMPQPEKTHHIYHAIPEIIPLMPEVVPESHGSHIPMSEGESGPHGQLPEGEPEPHSAHGPMPEGEPGMRLQACVQPPPKFKACPTEAWMWLSVPLLLYTLERISRFVGASGQPLEITRVVEHPNDVIEVEFYQKDFKAKPGQSIWLRCPDISYVECHPFTLTSLPTPERPVFTIHMLVLGDWTSRARKLMTALPSCFDHKGQLYRESAASQDGSHEELSTPKPHDGTVCQIRGLDSRLDQVCVACDISPELRPGTEVITMENPPKEGHPSGLPKFYSYGPHGSAMEDIFRYEVSLCVAGGIGITPFAAVLTMILKRSKMAENSKLRRIYLVWSCRTIRSFEWFVNLINAVQQHLWDGNKPDFLNVYLHVTGKSDVEREDLCPEPQLERCRFRRGRPDLKELFKDLSRRHEETAVGVFCCGPKSLNSSVRQQCFKSKGRSATFMFNKESF